MEQEAPLRILVTGGLGFVGSNFIHHLMKKGNEFSIVNLDSLSYGSNFSNLSGLAHDARYKFVKGDITNPDTVRSLVGEVDTVVNFAAETHVDRSISAGAPFVQSNMVGVSTLLEELRHSNRELSFVQVGTDEEYGNALRGPFTEEDPLNPSSPYAASKASATMLVVSYVRTYGLNASVTRCTNNYGPYQFPEKLIPKSIIRTKMGLNVPIYGDGQNSRDWIHVEDHCEALELVMRRGKRGSVYNIAGRNELANLDLVKMILKAMKKPESLIEFVEDRPGHDKRYSLNDEKIRNELGWKPKHKFESGLEETIQWYLENEKWWRPIANEKTLSAAPWKLDW